MYFEDKDFKTDVHLKEAVEIAKKLTLKTGPSSLMGDRSY